MSDPFECLVMDGVVWDELWEGRPYYGISKTAMIDSPSMPVRPLGVSFEGRGWLMIGVSGGPKR